MTGRAVADPEAVRALAEQLDAAANPVLVAGPDIDAIGRLGPRRSPSPSASACRSGRRPATGGDRLGFPEGHPNFRGVLPPAIGPVAQTLEAHDLILVVGSSVFPYYPYIPGPLLPEGAKLVAITSDPDEAARAPMGDAIVADVKLTLEALLEVVPESSRPRPEPNQQPQEIPPTDPLNPSTVHTALGEVLPEDGIVVLESPTSTLALRNQLRLSRPGSYYFAAGGGLGFGLAASVGVQLAQPDRPVVCVLGEGSAQYAISAFWSAVAYKTPPSPSSSSATRSTGSSSGSPKPRGSAALPASTCPSSTSPRSPRATGSRPTAPPTATASATRSPPRSSPRSRSWSKSR